LGGQISRPIIANPARFQEKTGFGLSPRAISNVPPRAAAGNSVSARELFQHDHSRHSGVN
jgi:hypothetical protein